MAAQSARKKNNFPYKSLIGSLFIGFVMLYLVFHALNGNHGVYALFKEQKREATNAVSLAELRADRTQLEHRVNMISNETLDLDLLDEQARRVLGYTKPDELIYLLPKE